MNKRKPFLSSPSYKSLLSIVILYLVIKTWQSFYYDLCGVMLWNKCGVKEENYVCRKPWQEKKNVIRTKEKKKGKERKRNWKKSDRFWNMAMALWCFYVFYVWRLWLFEGLKLLYLAFVRICDAWSCKEWSLGPTQWYLTLCFSRSVELAKSWWLFKLRISKYTMP